MTTPKIKLSSGYEMPLFGLGTFRVPNSRESIDLIKTAIKYGYRLIDTATLYQNEHEVGVAIKESIDEGVVKREDLFIVSKIWPIDNSPELVSNALSRSLSLLETPYLDLYLIHWPVRFVDRSGREREDMTFHYFPHTEEDKVGYDPENILNVWKVLESLVNEGKIRSIGVSNFSKSKLGHLLDHSTIKPVVNQVECHPYFKQMDLLNYCTARDVRLMGYFPLTAGKDIEGHDKLLDNKIIKNISLKYNKSPAQICIRWSIDRGVIVIPKSSSPKRLLENMTIFDFKLSDEDMNIINTIDIEVRLGLGVQFLAPGSDVKRLLWEE